MQRTLSLRTSHPLCGVLAISSFVCDAMLGRVCRWLRLLGYETYYNPKEDDESLLEKAKTLGYTLLTKDLHLYKRALKCGVKVFYVEGDDFYDQLGRIVRAFGLRLEIDPTRSFCPKCGGKIRNIDKLRVASLVPQSTLKRYSEYWICTSCGKVYWKGVMWRSMNIVVERVRTKGV